MYKEKVIPFFHSFFTRRHNKRRPGGPEGVSHCIADSRKANLHLHTRTRTHNIHIHIQVIIDVVVAVVCLLSFFSPTILDHRKRRREAKMIVFILFFFFLLCSVLSQMAPNIVCMLLDEKRSPGNQTRVYARSLAHSIQSSHTVCIRFFEPRKQSEKRCRRTPDVGMTNGC